MEEKHAYRLIRDLFAHKDAIFGELKRASSLSHSNSVVESRPRAISTDESNRKANMEARARAIIDSKSGNGGGGSRSRATSPAPGPRGHRRDRSSGGPETRFPIVASAVNPVDVHKSRNSVGSPIRAGLALEVPGSVESSPVVEGGVSGIQPLRTVTNGSDPVVSLPVPDGIVDEVGVEKRNSLGRSGHVTAGKRLATARRGGSTSRARQSVDSTQLEQRPVGVSLVDAPMDD
jgi:hypothetical protein